MTSSEVPVPAGQKADLAAMMRDYVAEMATIIPGVDPKQPYSDFELCWTEPDRRWPFWLKSGDLNAGFALIGRDEGRYEMAEFFVVPRFRRQGIGKFTARRLIASHPGRWRITQRESNTAGTAFWRRVLDGFAVYEDIATNDGAIRREQHFTIS